MTRRTYGQYCGVAHALDLIGERWTLLIIRELLTGPKRFKDLLKHLPGIGTNLLSKRLQWLEAADVATRRMLPAPASTEAYDLTAYGRALEPVLLSLARWGYQSIPSPTPETAHFGGWSVLAMKAVFRSDKAAGVDDVYEYRIDDEVFHARVQDGMLTTDQGPAMQPSFVLTTDGETFLALVSGQVTAEDALRAGRLQLDGDREAFARSAEMLDVSPLQRENRELKVLDLTGRPSPYARRIR